MIGIMNLFPKGFLIDLYIVSLIMISDKDMQYHLRKTILKMI